MQISGIKQEKTKLRSTLLKARDIIPDDVKKRSDEAIFSRIISLEEYKSADTIFTYVSKGSEADTYRIIEQALADKKLVAAPKCAAGFTMNFYYINSINELEPGAFGVLEPVAGLKRADCLCGLCIVPGIAFDKSGLRLGYGKGYYDRFLPQFNGTAAGICKSDFLLERLPHYETDYKVDIVITDK